ncbi:GNAT family N-acetyltransferase [Halarchaeum grantii]|uniref:GNAT family N-acetyltransferase n=1 Tax=Halarchaeum grantii TaxID=1193105 RepID=A0A830FAD2_9EURY|nr:GNAT family N-acetyltransferase [Halarchaeum grantii]GGL35175.1 GNAT family N-acetyltransferase [Halarchaeum grantii]
MTQSTTRTTTPDERLREPSHSFLDADGERVTIDTATASDAAALRAMYGRFDPTDRAQGLPPARREERNEWVDTLLAGRSVVARRDGRTVGHAALLESGDGHELAVFVAPDARGVGVGTGLLRGLLGAHRSAGGGRVWLAVEPSNRCARALYRRFGFDVAERGRFEITMTRQV